MCCVTILAAEEINVLQLFYLARFNFIVILSKLVMLSSMSMLTLPHGEFMVTTSLLIFLITAFPRTKIFPLQSCSTCIFLPPQHRLGSFVTS